jgi:hypothetical protein
MTWLLLLLLGPAKAQPQTGAIVVLQNYTETSVYVQGYTIVNGMQKRGDTLTLFKNAANKAFENNVPVGVRYYTVYDANQRLLLRDFPVQVRSPNTFLFVRKSPVDAKRIVLEVR